MSDNPFSLDNSFDNGDFIGEKEWFFLFWIAKARAEEIKSNSLAPGKAQYSVSEVDGIIRNFKDSYVGLLRDIHLMVVTESTSKIRQGIEQGYIDADMITQEMLDELEKLRIEAAKIPGYEKKIQDDALKIDELKSQSPHCS